jgi:hypothetical protein
VADTSFVGETAVMPAEFIARLKVQDDLRKRTVRRSLAGVAVAVLHVLFILVLLASEWVPAVRPKVHRPIPLTWLLLPPEPAKVPRVTPISPRKEAPAWTAPTYVLPRVIRPPEENNQIDLGLALGRSLACGANSFEYLTPQQRAACKRQPWHFVYDRYGNIILDAVPRVAEEPKPRPSDIQAHERNTAPDCPKYIDPNAPCLSDITGLKP